MKTIYTLHEYGSPTHFNGLCTLAEQNGYKVKHREIRQRNAIKRLLFELNFHIVANIIFLLSLPFRKRCKVVLAIAPYNSLLPLLMKILHKHEVYYFTSYTCWDQTMSVHSLKGNTKLLKSWKRFTNEYVKHIFAVSQKTKDEIVINGFSSSERVSVVNHSLKKNINPGQQTKTLTFVQVGRLSPAKGVIELLEFFKRNRNYSISFVGSGALQAEVEVASKEYDNIHYLGYVKSFDKLVEIYKGHSFVIMNSQRLPDSAWEELFGMALIEGMACGCVPIASNHTGPKEIIRNGVNGLLYAANNLNKTLLKLTELSNDKYLDIREQTINSTQQYKRENISHRWKKVLD